MSRLPTVTDQNASPAAAGLFDAIRGKVGMVPNLYRVTANQPAVLEGLLTLGEKLGGGSFDPATREAIALAVAGENACDYCASAHTAISKGMKVADDEVASRLLGKSADPRVQAILDFAVAVTREKGFVSDADLTTAREAGLSDADIIEVIGNVVANIFTNYINHVAQTEIDFPVVTAKAS